MNKNGNCVIRLDGIYPPVPTAFDKEDRIAAGPLAKNIEALNKFDLRGYIILGSNGEYVMLSPEEKLTVLKTAREAIPNDRLMIAGTGCQSTGETVDLTKKSAETGADAALVITPYYYRKLMTPRVLINHFRTVADASPIPILIYNMPACTGIDLDVETIVELSGHPNIIGLKDSGGNVVKIGGICRQLRNQPGSGFQVLAGSAGFLLPALTVGAVGGVLALANIAPAQCIDIYKYYLEGRSAEARELQCKMIPVNTAVTAKWGVPALKAAMDTLGLYGGPVRLPLQSISQDVHQQLENVLKTGELK